MSRLIEMGLRGPVSAEQLVDLARIRHNQAHLLTLISEMLTFVRSESGRMEYRLGEVSAYEALREVAEMLRDAVDERHSSSSSRRDVRMLSCGRIQIACARSS